MRSTQPGHPPWVGVIGKLTSQNAVMFCGWGVKAGIVGECVAGKTVCSLAISGHRYLSALPMRSLHNRALYKCPITFTLLFVLDPVGCLASLPSARQHPRYGDCLEVKREYYQNCSVLDCVTQCSQSAAYLYEQFLQVQQIGLSHWDRYVVHRGGCLELYCCNMVEWFWCDSSLISTTSWFPSVL